MQALRFTLCAKTGMHPIWNHKTKWNPEPKHVDTLCIPGETVMPFPSSLSPSVTCQKATSEQPGLHAAPEARRDQVHTWWAHTLHICDVHCVTKARSAPGPWIQGWATAASCSLLPKRPVSLVMKLLARDLDSRMAVTSKSPGDKDKSLPTAVENRCLSLLFWQDNDHF